MRNRLVALYTCLTLPALAAMTSACGDSDTTSVFDGDCATNFQQILPNDPPLSLRFTLSGDCDFTTFSGVSVEAEQFFSVEDANGNRTFTGTTVYTDADGNTLTASVAGIATFAGEGVTFSGEETYIGGTGIFNGVSGSGDVEGVANLNSQGLGTGDAEYTVDGTVAIPE
jgi:hypothetical protein